jgi:predicted kinase
MQKPTLYIISGLSFAGKTYLCNILVKKFGFETVDVDVTKENMYGKGLKDDDLTHEQWVKIYDATDKQIEKYLNDGKSVLDASRNFRKLERMNAKKIAERSGADFIIIYVKTPEDVVRQRWVENRRKQTRHDVEDNNFEEIINFFEPPSFDENPVILNYGDDIEKWIKDNL